MIAATILSVLACIVLVGAEYKRATSLRIVAKPIASLGFIAVGVLAARGLWDDYQHWVVVGLVLGAAGDVALLGTSSRAFLAGLGAFLLGHIAYIVAFAQLAGVETWLDVRALVPLAMGLGVLAYVWPRLGTMRAPVIAYVIAIVTMMSAAIAAARVLEIPQPNRILLLAGAALFFASDFAVARDKFPRTGNPAGPSRVRRDSASRSRTRDPLGERPQGFVSASFVNRAWGLPAYYAGQLLIAWSTAPALAG